MTEITNQVADFETLVASILAAPMAHSTRGRYARKLREFLEWWDQTGRRPFSPELVSAYAGWKHDNKNPAFDIQHALQAVRAFARAAAQRRWIDAITLDGIMQIRGPKIYPIRTGQWLTEEQMLKLMKQPDRETMSGKRDYVLLGLLLYCGLRCDEAALVRFEHVQIRDSRPALVNLVGKGDKRRSIPMPTWLFCAIQEWVLDAGLTTGYILRAMPGHHQRVRTDKKMGRTGVWMRMKLHAVAAGFGDIIPHDLRRTFGRVSRANGAELEQIQQSYGHAQLTTTMQYLGGTQDFVNAPCDKLPVPE